MAKAPIGYEEFRQSLKAGAIGRLYLFEGDEEYLKSLSLHLLSDQLLTGPFGDMNRTELKDPDAAALIAACETLPLMASRRLVVVRESGMLSGKSGDYDEADAAARLRDYLPGLPETTVLLFYVRSNADKRKRLYKVLGETGAIVRFDRQTKEMLRKYIATTLHKEGLRISGDACDLLQFSVGDDLTVLNGELNKLISSVMGKDEVTADDIRSICSLNTEYKVFELASTVLKGNGPQAFNMLNGLIRDGEQRLMLLSLLCRQCRQMFDAAVMKKTGAQSYQIAQQLGIPAFAARELMELSGKYSIDQLAQMVHDCTETEYLVKSGQLPEEGSMERAMTAILALRGKN